MLKPIPKIVKDWSVADLLPVLRDAAVRHIHGSAHNDLYRNGQVVEERSKLRMRKFLEGKLVCECRFFSRLLIEFFALKQIHARPVQIVTFDPQYGDTRHHALEVFAENKWVFVEGHCFVLQGNSAGELKLKLDAQEMHVQHVVRLTQKSIEPGFSIEREMLPLMHDDQALLRWFGAMVGGIVVDGQLLIAQGDESRVGILFKHALRTWNLPLKLTLLGAV